MAVFTYTCYIYYMYKVPHSCVYYTYTIKLCMVVSAYTIKFLIVVYYTHAYTRMVVSAAL